MPTQGRTGGRFSADWRPALTSSPLRCPPSWTLARIGSAVQNATHPGPNGFVCSDHKGRRSEGVLFDGSGSMRDYLPARPSFTGDLEFEQREWSDGVVCTPTSWARLDGWPRQSCCLSGVGSARREEGESMLGRGRINRTRRLL